MSGIIQIGQERYIPASKRPDGTVRKERKVRQGFIPQEDVLKYSIVQQRQQKKSQQTFLKSSHDLLLMLLQDMSMDDIKRIQPEIIDSQGSLTTQLLTLSDQDNVILESLITNADFDTLSKVIERLQLKMPSTRSEMLLLLENTLNSVSKRKYNFTKKQDPSPQIHPDLEKEVVDPLIQKQECEKKIKALKKKLRQIDQITEKLAQNQEINQEQKQKLDSKEKLEASLKELQDSLEKMMLV